MALRDKTRHRQSVTVTKPKHAIFISISIYFCLSILSTFVDSPGTYGVRRGHEARALTPHKAAPGC